MARRKSIPFEGGCGDPGVGTDRGLVGFGVWWALPSPGGAAQKLCLCLDPQQTQPRLQRGIFVREKCDEKMHGVSRAASGNRSCVWKNKGQVQDSWKCTSGMQCVCP